MAGVPDPGYFARHDASGTPGTPRTPGAPRPAAAPHQGAELRSAG
jgi:hypothetical protein